MRRLAINFIVGMALLAACARVADSAAPAPDLVEVDVFTAATDGYFAYLIPSLTTTTRGTLLAICEGRKSNLEDLGNNDVVIKRSTDGGRTWSAMQLIHDEGDAVTIGNPTAIVDRDTGTIWLFLSRNATEILLTHSADEGESWAKPIDITAQVKMKDWKFYAVGPGAGIQLAHGPKRGRLIVPAYHRLTADKSGESYSHTFFSDDHGKTWQLGSTVGPHTNECQVAEIVTDGKPQLLLNARNHWARSGGKPELAGVRIIARSSDAGETWGEPAFDKTLVEPTCHASLLRYTWADQGDRSRLLFSNPGSNRREKLTVRLSYDEGQTWPISRTIHAGVAAYSSLAVLRGGRIGLLSDRDNYKTLTFASFTLSWLTEGQDQGGRER